MVRLRKQLAERTLTAIREACRKVETGETPLRFYFQHTDVIPEVNRDAKNVAEVCLRGREVTMNIILWDKRTWVINHPERYSDAAVDFAQYHHEAYTDERNCFFGNCSEELCDCGTAANLLR